MALKLRRGTDLERQSVIFEEGELVYATNTKTLWVGDGQTLGGLKIGGGVEETPIALTRDLNLNNFDIVGNGNIDISGVVAAGQLLGDLVGTVEGDVRGADSSIIINSATNEVFGNFVGDGSGLTNLPIEGIVEGSNYRINIVGDDSSTLVDTVNGAIYPSEIGGTGVLVNTEFVMVGDTLRNFINFELKNPSSNLLTSNSDRGGIFFSRNDVNGKEIEAVIGGGRGGIYLIVYPDGGGILEQNILLLTKDGNVGLGTYDPQEKLDVRGNITATGTVQFGRITTATRDALTAENGMVIYNTTVGRFQGYQNNSWINLDNASTA